MPHRFKPDTSANRKIILAYCFPAVCNKSHAAPARLQALWPLPDWMGTLKGSSLRLVRLLSLMFAFRGRKPMPIIRLFDVSARMAFSLAHIKQWPRARSLIICARHAALLRGDFVITRRQAASAIMLRHGWQRMDAIHPSKIRGGFTKKVRFSPSLLYLDTPERSRCGLRPNAALRGWWRRLHPVPARTGRPCPNRSGNRKTYLKHFATVQSIPKLADNLVPETFFFQPVHPGRRWLTIGAGIEHKIINA